MRWSLPALAASLLLTGLPALAPDARAAGGDLPELQKLVDVPGKPAGKKSGLNPVPRRTWTKSPSVTWPKADTAEVRLTADGKAAPRVRAGKLPVRLSAAPGKGKAAERAVTAEVEVADRATTDKAGIDGVLLAVRRDDRAQDTAKVRVELDYKGFRNAYGGDWGSRLRFTALPACALTTPQKAECRTRTPVATTNDPAKGTLTATVPAPPAKASGAAKRGTRAAAGATVLAAAAAPNGASGDYRATSLSPSGSWQAGGSSGDFTWSYPMDIPSSMGGPGPMLGLSYSSASVDGRSSASSQQSSWVGDGWDTGANFIERQYVPCSNDRKEGSGYNNPKHPTGDLCQGPPVVTLSLNGSSTQLVLDDKTKKWVPVGDDGSRVELLKGAANGDKEKEYWRVTNEEGVQYYFGMDRLPGWASGKPETNSAWSVPVYGNHSGEPCHKAAYADSVCDQVYRWNLDYVVDLRGNAMTYWYDKERNHYGSNVTREGKSTNRAYDRGGWLKRISYGLRSDALFADAPAQVVFDVAERCVKTTSFDCAESKLTSEAKWEVTRNWPDVPADQLCAAGKECKDRYAPTFFTRKRLTSITTEILKDGKHQPVDTWAFTQDFKSTGDGGVAGDYPLWLSAIRHTGKNGTPISLPPVTFQGKQLPNRVDNDSDGNPPFLRWRVETIQTETGARIAVEYAKPECSTETSPKKLPDAPHTNTMRCYPVVNEVPDPTDETGLKKKYFTDWFHKHRVDEVREEDKNGTSPTKVTTFKYLGDPAWAYDDDSELLSEKARTWSQWRGYEKVRTLVGTAPDKRSQVETVYFRGMDGDKLPSGKREVKIKDSEGGTVDDHELYAGQIRESLYYDGEGGPLQSATLYTPWVRGPTATRKRDEGAEPLQAFMAGTAKVASRTVLSGDRGQRRTAVEHAYDSRGRLEHTTDQGDLSKTGDETCTRYEYVNDAAKHVYTPQKRVETLTKACDAKDIARPADVGSDKVMHYDADYNVTKVESLSDYKDGKPVYRVDGSSTFDKYGRVTSVTDHEGNTTRTAYTPATGTLPVKTVVTNPKGHTDTTELDPARGLALAKEDTNKRRQVLEYDALGRLVKTWSPDRDPATQTPDAEFSYTVTPDGPVVITTKKLLERGDYVVTYDIYDGALRLRQTQQPALDGGRVITDTFYDSRGLVWKENGAHFNSLDPEPKLWTSDDNKVPASTRTEYDGQGRPVATIARKFGEETWRTTTSYGGDWVAVDPPKGETPTMSLVDAQGRKTELRQFKGEGPSGAYDRTRYTYERRGMLESVTDQAGNVWSYKYDLRGRVYESKDPDKGTTKSTYDKGDRLLTTTDGRDPAKTIAYEYDTLGRVTGTYEGSLKGRKLTEQTYDSLPGALGMPVSTTRFVDGNAYKQEVTGYDKEYRPLGSKITIPASEGKLAGTYEYSSTYTKTTGMPQTMTQPAVAGLPKERTSVGYNGLDMVTTMAVAGKTFVAGTEYTPLGDVVRTRVGPAGKQLITSREFDEQTRRPLRTVFDQEVGTTGTARISDIRTAYDQAGNILKITDAQGPNPTAATTDTQCFAYDYLRRMTEAWTSAKAGECTSLTGSPAAKPEVGGPNPYWTSYTFDAAGNRRTEVKHDVTGDTTKDVTRDYEYAEGGTTTSKLMKVRTKGPEGEREDTFGYDKVGNTTTRTVMGTTQDLEWDVEGHLERVTEGSGDKAKKTEYVYDAGGNRLIRRDPNGTTLYLPGTEVRLDKSGNIVKGTRYYQHPAGPAMVRTAEGGKVTTTYLLSDHNGTATMAVDSASGAVTRRAFMPFGEPRGKKPSMWPDEKGFVGGTTDESTGLTHLGAREYDPAIGRFISVDPVMDMAESQTMNPYAYANNSPVTFSDPSGQFWGIPQLIHAAIKLYKKAYAALTGGTPPAPSKPVPSVSKKDVERARWLKKQSKMDMVMHVAKEAVKEASGYNDIVDCLNGALGTCAMIAAEAAIPFAGKAKRLLKALEKAWSAYRKWGEEVRWATGIIKRADADAKAMAKYTEDMADWKKQADAAKAAKKAKAEEAEATAAKKADSNGDGGGGDGTQSGSGAGESCRVNSFTPETKVLMADGTTKPIKDVKPGDKVVAKDPETGKTAVKKVTAQIIGKGKKNLVEVTIDTDGKKGAKTAKATATDGHPFWVPELREWVKATDLKSGDWLETGSGSRVQVTAVKRWTQQATVYNLTVADIHTYYVVTGSTTALVHNCGVEVSKSENSITISHEASGSGVIADLDAKGNLTLMMDNFPDRGSPLRGKQMFADVMEHFGDRVQSIQGYWRYGDNLGAFNKAVAEGMSMRAAARDTWTGKRAAEFGFTRVKILQADEGVDGFTVVSALFRRE
ncbi:intein C-terminal splicing region/RHS repeat-associated core domain-containing protein [Streptomyces sp. DI166]|uniref:polymorphic toxin-type HINT domain-containing protein n=1 Tax=Streptomyces sp. DI166 TaxID=1839783 RepID=UPI0007F44D7A|nr:polymorphic toxin-type HINT domain-containing protein [Streptomyces sp. DI166]SBT89725.1 intein C-terminal splicing region/RHS repeat-associated core domain-containing protein [Streptomyces sp. DI166]